MEVNDMYPACEAHSATTVSNNQFILNSYDVKYDISGVREFSLLKYVPQHPSNHWIELLILFLLLG